MQQHFIALDSMMGGADGAFGGGAQALMGQTPTTSSMLAALHQDAFPGVDGGGQFNPENYGLPSYLDAGAPHDDPLAVHPGGLGFSDFGGPIGSFDVGGFMPQDLGLGSSAGDHDHEPEVKAEGV
jgi:regulatory factor X